MEWWVVSFSCDIYRFFMLIPMIRDFLADTISRNDMLKSYLRSEEAY